MWPWRRNGNDKLVARVDTVLKRDASTFEVLNDTVIRLRVTAQELERITREMAEYERASED